MQRNLAQFRTLLTILGLTAAGSAVWLGILAGIWLLLQRNGVMTDLWAMIEALSTAVAAAALLGGGYVAYRELDELSSTRYIDVSNELFQELNSPENIAARRWVLLELPDDPVEGLASLSDEGRDAAKRVLNSLDHVAFLTQLGWIPDEMIMPWMNPMVVKAWRKLKPYVIYERERRREYDYYIYAEELGEKCQEWRARYLPDSDIILVDDAL